MEQNTMSRTEKFSRNVLFAVLAEIISSILSFVVRLIFIQNLKIEYLGIRGLFSNILTVLSLAELGAGSAIIYSMYKPLAEKDTEKIKSLIQLYKNIYRSVGLFILVLGMLFFPFLDFFIRERPSISSGEFNIIYALTVFQTAVTYFFSYRYSIYTANQEGFVLTKYGIFFSAFKSAAQIAALLLCKNYIIYLCTGIAFSLLQNLVLSAKANRDFPFLKEPAKPLDKDSRNKIRKNIAAMFLYRLGVTASMTIDTLLMSKFFGLVTVGLYSNYHLVIGYSDKIFSTILGKIVPSLGNLLVTSDKRKQMQVFTVLQMVYYWLTTYLAVGLIILLNPLIALLFGRDYLLPQAVVTMLAINIALTNFQRPCSFIRDAAGLFWYGKFRPLATAILNILCSLAAIHFWGLAGIMIGTALANVLTYVWYDPYIVFKHTLKGKLSGYYIRYLKHWGLLLVLTLVCRKLQQLVHTGSGAGDFLCGALIVTAVVNGIFFLLYSRSDSMAYLKNSVIQFMKNRGSGHGL